MPIWHIAVIPDVVTGFCSASATQRRPATTPLAPSQTRLKKLEDRAHPTFGGLTVGGEATDGA